MKIKIFGIIFLSLLLQACAGSSSGAGNGNGAPASGEETQAMKEAKEKCANTPTGSGIDIRYVMSENHDGNACTTGCQIFQSIEAYCGGLRNDQINNNCAKAQREKTFQSDCANN